MSAKKHPRLQRGFGSIRYLGEGRTNPYAVYPPEYVLSEAGHLTYKRALCYVPDWYTGFAVLVSYKAGTYKPGDELRLARLDRDVSELSDLAQAIMRDYSLISQENVLKRPLNAVWDEFIEYRFGDHAPRRFSTTLERQFSFARTNLSPLMKKDITTVKVNEIQKVINDLSDDLSRSSLSVILSRLKQVLNFAIDREYISTNFAQRVTIPDRAAAREAGTPFSREELAVIHKLAMEGDEEAITILIHCLSGFRYSAYKDPGFIVDIEEGFFEGGVKWGGPRQVPIHPFLFRFLPRPIYPQSMPTEYAKFHQFMEDHHLRDHTPHDCRHTFKVLCDRYDVSPIAQRAMMGHALGKDIHDSVYAHVDIQDLMQEICKIKIDVCGFL